MFRDGPDRSIIDRSGVASRVQGLLTCLGRHPSHLSFALLGPLSVSGRYLALEGYHLLFPLHSQAEVLVVGVVSIPTGLAPSLVWVSTHLRVRTSPQPHNAHRFEVGLLLDRSPLIKESRLVSSPGRTDMLKFHPSSSSEWGGSSSHSPSFNPSNNPVRRSPHHPDDPFEDRCHVLGPHRVSSSATSFIVPRAKASTGSRHLIAFILVPSPRWIHPQVHLRIPCYDFSFLQASRFVPVRFIPPRSSPEDPVGRSDGRCVQGAGTYPA